MLAEWIKPCERHLHWSAKSTFSGNGNVIRAKFKSFLSHVTNKHTDLDDPLFSKYVHGSLQPRKWLQVGMFSSLMRWDSIEKVQSANENSSVWLHVLYVGPKKFITNVRICFNLFILRVCRLWSAIQRTDELCLSQGNYAGNSSCSDQLSRGGFILYSTSLPLKWLPMCSSYSALWLHFLE